MRRAAALFLMIVLGCARIVDPALDPRAEVMMPPLVYSRWWSMVESCSGLSGSMAAISWYQVPGSGTVESRDGPIRAYWSPGSNRIVMAGELVYNGSVVRHEMLHALIRQTSGHPREYFLGRCAGVVTCGSNCLNDAGPAAIPALDVARITPQELRLDVSVVPQLPKMNIDEGVFTVVVTATNPKPYPVVVLLSQGSSHTFAMTATRFGAPDAGPTVWATIVDVAVSYFGAGEKKQQYFDYSIGSAAGMQTMSSGVYRLIGTYDVSTVTLSNVTIGP